MVRVRRTPLSRHPLLQHGPVCGMDVFNTWRLTGSLARSHVYSRLCLISTEQMRCCWWFELSRRRTAIARRVRSDIQRRLRFLPSYCKALCCDGFFSDYCYWFVVASPLWTRFHPQSRGLRCLIARHRASRAVVWRSTRSAD